jgi:hypothetical protein
VSCGTENWCSIYGSGRGDNFFSDYIHPILFWHTGILAVLSIGIMLLECEADHSYL